MIGTVVIAPPGPRGTPAPHVFHNPPPPGFAVAAMDFVVQADGPGRSQVSTETRVFANGASARRAAPRHEQLSS